ncbi:MAG: hypothetical protein IJ479_08980 [Alphaproteobacteria bacterium]|nr:hypothetical protein [Alphaproteobacteria bacterium]
MSLPDFDPAIHKEISNVPVVRWILGSNPRMTRTTGGAQLETMCFRDRVASTESMTKDVL